MEQNQLVVLILILLVIVALAGVAWLLFGKNGLFRRPKLRNLSVEDLERKRAEFQAQLHEQGLMDLEKAVSENATFIQQDVRKTASKMSGYMQQELQRALDEEFSEYHRAADDINKLLKESLSKTRSTIEQQRQSMNQQMHQELVAEKQRLLEQFEANMTEVVSYYVMTALGDKLNLDEQMNYVLAQLETNKQAIAEDLKSGL